MDRRWQVTWIGAALIGVCIGIILGALGGGGGILTVPVLAYGFGLAMHEASAASLVIVGLSSAVALIAHARAGRVDWMRGSVFAAFGVLGSAAGALLARGSDPDWLMVAFSLLLGVVAALMLRGRPLEGADEDTGGAHAAPSRIGARVVLAGLGVGLLTGFFGVGGGFAIVPALTLLLGMPMPVAVATSLVVIVLNGVVAFAAKAAIGLSLDVPLIAVFTLATMAGSLAGSRITGLVDPVVLRRAFAWLLASVAIATLIASVTTLVA